MTGMAETIAIRISGVIIVKKIFWGGCYLLLLLTASSTFANTQLDPDREWGVALNPFNLVVGSGLSTAFSHFNHDRAQEATVVIFYNDSEDVQHNRVEYHYRWFLGQQMKGTYFSAVARYNHMSGSCMGSCTYGDDYSGENYTGSLDRAGLGLGMGVRYFYSSGVYFGVGFVVGRYFVGERKDISSATGDGLVKEFFDIHFLKIGYAF